MRMLEDAVGELPEAHQAENTNNSGGEKHHADVSAKDDAIIRMCI